jgi:ubiquinone/menaquinone biosynthesis C-methylase UbiE
MESRAKGPALALAGLLVSAVAGAGEAEPRFPELRWVPADVDVVVGFSPPAADAADTWSRLRAELLFAIGIGDSGPVVEAALSSTDRGLIAAWKREGGSSVVAILHGEPALPEASGETTSHVHRDQTIRLIPPAWAVATVEPRLVIFGDRPAVERCLDTRAGAGAAVTDQPDRSSVLAVQQSAAFWGVLGARWLGLDTVPANRLRNVRSALTRLRWSTLAADVSDHVAFRLRARLADEEEAAVVEDALRSHVDTLRAEARQGTPAVLESMEGAVVGRNGADVDLSISLSSGALAALHRSETARRLVTLRLRDAEREEWQRAADVVDHLGVKPGDRVADVGAGAGFFTVALARVVGEHGKVYAVEIDAKALARLRQRAEAGRFTQIEVVEGAADDPRLPAGSLDAALIVNAYHEMPHHERMLAGLAAALKPGGRLVLVEPFSAELRREPRERQIEKHVLAPELAEDELRRAGLDVVARVEQFARTPDSQGSYWLIEARRPEALTRTVGDPSCRSIMEADDEQGSKPDLSRHDFGYDRERWTARPSTKSSDISASWSRASATTCGRLPKVSATSPTGSTASPTGSRASPTGSTASPAKSAV